ncbi:hypothetical protein CEXT_777041 [Caerostris extrusa]|uniref:Uncharacterized protein n=1 Tax=Caerostris extrusa TaxID=172846 RepID=A0AAV4V5G4_CAEEX|nr:hypothetical protein CEXT_777041 [Caerostris extrusa]
MQQFPVFNQRTCFENVFQEDTLVEDRLLDVLILSIIPPLLTNCITVIDFDEDQIEGVVKENESHCRSRDVGTTIRSTDSTLDFRARRPDSSQTSEAKNRHCISVGRISRFGS